MVDALECSIMSNFVAADREQLKRLDQESLIELILVLQEQLAAQQVFGPGIAGSTGERQSQ